MSSRQLSYHICLIFKEVGIDISTLFIISFNLWPSKFYLDRSSSPSKNEFSLIENSWSLLFSAEFRTDTMSCFVLVPYFRYVSLSCSHQQDMSFGSMSDELDQVRLHQHLFTPFLQHLLTSQVFLLHTHSHQTLTTIVGLSLIVNKNLRFNSVLLTREIQTWQVCTGGFEFISSGTLNLNVDFTDNQEEALQKINLIHYSTSLIMM